MQDVTVTSNLAGWEPVLRRWFAVLDAYRAACNGTDVAFWYNERATLSAVAGALWLSGAVVLEEYCTSRGGDGPDASKGRTDMWCRIDGDEYTVEAKQGKASYPTTPNTLKLWANIQLESAEKQCRTDKLGGKDRLAMVFMVPSLLNAPSKTTLKAWLDAIESVEADMKAYQLQSPEIQAPENERYYPGVILLGRHVLCVPAHNNGRR